MADIAVDTPFVELLISGWEPVAAKEAAVDSADVSMDVSDCRPVRTFATLEPFTRFWEPLMRPEANSSVKAVVAPAAPSIGTGPPTRTSGNPSMTVV